jgi:hypothetical protein
MILQILGFAALAHLAAEFMYPYHQIPDKPFKCNLCLGFWISIIPYFFQWGISAVLLAAITGVASETIYKILNRL